MSVARSGLNTRASDFSEALHLELGIHLDCTDDVSQRDWRKLVDKLGLARDYDKINKQTRKTDAALRIWSHKSPHDSNGRKLVKVLIDMGRRDAASAVEYHLGEEFNPNTNATEDLFDVLDRAARLGNVEVLRKELDDSRGEDVERKFSKKPYSLLHSAATYGHLLAVEFLVRRGFFVNRRNQEGKTPREVAKQLGHQQVSEYLEEIEQKGEVGGKPAMSVEAAEYCVERNELDMLTYKGDLNGIRRLLKQGCDPNDAGKQNWSPLHTAVERNNLEAVKLLVEYEAKLDTQNYKSYTPEGWARFNGHGDIADYLKVVKKSRAAFQSARTASHSPQPGRTESTREDHRIVITLHRQVADQPEEYMVEGQSIDEVCKGISEQLEVVITALVDLTTKLRISDVSQLKQGQDVLVLAREEEEKFQEDKHDAHKDKSEICNTSIRLFSRLWSSAAVPLTFLREEEFEAILGRASKLLHTEINALHSTSTLTEIRTAEELTQHQRVIAASSSEDIQKAAEKLSLQRVADPVSVTVTHRGAHLFERKTGVFISIPEYAVKDEDTVTVKLTVCEPNVRMDFGSDDLRLISDPILVETTPPGYSFSKPVQIKLPHCGLVNKQRKVAGEVKLLTAPATSDEQSPIQFDYVSVADFTSEERCLRFQVHHFSWFCALIYNLVTWGECVASVHYPAELTVGHLPQLQLRLLCYPNLHIYAMGARQHIGERYEQRKQVFSLGYGNKTDVTLRVTNSSWTVSPAATDIPFDNVWRKMMPLSCMTAIPAERTFTATWQGQLPPTQPLNVTVTVAGETTVQLPVLISSSSSHKQSVPSGGFTLPAAAENSLACFLDPTVADFRDYRGLAGELGFTLGEVADLASTRSPTRALLARCRRSHIDIKDLIEAAEYLERRDVVDLLRNMNVGL